MVSLLRKKLELLEEMLVLTEQMGGDTAELEPGVGDSFRDRINTLITTVTEVDRSLNAITPTAAEQELERKIASTVKRLSSANADLMASVKARQEIIGNKIARLKQSKGFLKNLDPSMPAEPTLVDSDL